MNISIYLRRENFIENLSTIAQLSKGGERMAESMRRFLQKIDFSYRLEADYYIHVSLSVEEYSLLQIFNN